MSGSLRSCYQLIYLSVDETNKKKKKLVHEILLQSNFWRWFLDDLREFGKAPRSVFLGFYLSIVIAMAYIVTAWSFVLIILLFIYSLYQAYRKRDDAPFGVVSFWWSG